MIDCEVAREDQGEIETDYGDTQEIVVQGEGLKTILVNSHLAFH